MIGFIDLVFVKRSSLSHLKVEKYAMKLYLLSCNSLRVNGQVTCRNICILKICEEILV